MNTKTQNTEDNYKKITEKERLKKEVTENSEKKDKYIALPFVTKSSIGEIMVEIELTKSEYKKCEKMTEEEFSEYLKLNATKTQITDFNVDYDIDIKDLELD